MKKEEDKITAFSKIQQIGIIVEDLDKAVEHYESLGIGPFKSLKRPPMKERKYYDKDLDPDSVWVDVRYTHIGEIMLELVKPVSGESVMMDFFKEHGEGCNHLGFFVDDLDEEVKKLGKKGFRVINYFERTNGTKSAYIDTDRVGGLQFELIQFVE